MKKQNNLEDIIRESRETAEVRIALLDILEQELKNYEMNLEFYYEFNEDGSKKPLEECSPYNRNRILAYEKIRESLVALI